MEILQLKYFCEAAIHQNFTRAAERFQVPVSGISYSVKRLEHEIGKKLFLRSANGITLTEEGRIFYEGAYRALELLEKSKARINEEENCVKGHIRILVQVNHNVINKIIEEFKEEYPDIDFTVSHNMYDKEKNFDFVINDELIYYKGYQKRLLLKEGFFLAARKDNPVVLTDEIDTELMKKQKYISMSAESCFYHHTHQVCFAYGFVPYITIFSDSPRDVIRYIEKGFGAGIVSEYDWAGSFSENVILKRIEGHNRNTYVYYLEDRLKTKATDLFLEKLIEYQN